MEISFLTDKAGSNKAAALLAAALVFLISLSSFLWVTHRFISIKTPHDMQSWNLTGDEPSYMLICQSIVLDRDVNLFNEASRGRRGAAFGCPTAGPHKARFDIEKGFVYSIHSPGLPLLMAPVFSAAIKFGLTPRYACVLFLNLFAAAGMTIMYALARTFDVPIIKSALVAALAGLTMPALVYSHQIYPDFPAAVILALGFLAIFSGSNRSGMSLYFMAAIAGLCASYLPWLHIRLAVFSVGIMLASIVQFRRTPLAIATSFFPAVLSAVLLMFFYQKWYGSPWPNAAYIAQTGSAPISAGVNIAVKGLAGIFFDGAKGLFFWSPFWIVAPAGLIMALRKNPVRISLLAFPCILYLWTIASFDAWWGGFCPPNRFILPLLPMLVVCGAVFLDRAKKHFIAIFAVLGTLAIFLAFKSAGTSLQDLYSGKHILETKPLLGSSYWFPIIAPDIKNFTSNEIPSLALWIALAVLLNIFIVFKFRQKNHSGKLLQMVRSC